MALLTIFLLLAVMNDPNYALWAAPQVIILAVIYVFSPQLDWWWYQRRPPEMEKPLKAFLQRFFKYYRQLAAVHKLRFERRVSMFVIANEFIPKAMEAVPEDIKGLIGATVAQLTFGQEDYRLSKYERVVVYPHPFPSPQHQYIHSVESFEEDGVVLFSLEQLVPGITQPNKFYNIALHEYARIFVEVYPAHPYPTLDVSHCPALEKISGFKMEIIKGFLGLPKVELLPAAINFFFTFPEAFQQELPEFYAVFKSIFNQDPVRGDLPVIDGRKQGMGI